MQVKLTRAVGGRKAGAILDLAPAAAQTLLSHDAAEKVAEEPKRTSTRKSAASKTEPESDAAE